MQTGFLEDRRLCLIEQVEVGFLIILGGSRCNGLNAGAVEQALDVGACAVARE